jgi:hypothetical protein
MKAYKGSRGVVPLILHFGRIHAPAALSPGKNKCTNYVGDRVDLTVILDILVETGIPPSHFCDFKTRLSFS